MSNARFSIIPAKAIMDKSLTPAQKITLAAVGLFADKEGWCWPSQSTLADITGQSRITVNRHIADLVKAGYLKIEHRYKKTGGQTSNMYQVIMDFKPTDLAKYESGVSPELQGVYQADDTGGVSPRRYTNTPSNKTSIKTNSRLTPGSKRKRSTKPRDPRLDHPAYKAYQQTAQWSVPVTFRDELIETVGDDPEAVERWRVLVRDWEGKGWNKRNIKDMLECYRTGGIKARKNGNQPRQTAQERNMALVQRRINNER